MTHRSATAAALAFAAVPGPARAAKRDGAAAAPIRPLPGLLTRSNGNTPMQDLIWIAITLGLLALTLAYVRLCDHA